MTPESERQSGGFVRFVAGNLSIIVIFLMFLLYMLITFHVMHAQDVDTETLRWARGKIDEIQTAMMSFLVGGGVGASAGYALATKRAITAESIQPKEKEAV